MTTAIEDQIHELKPKQQPQHRRVCFSYAAYAKTVIEQLRASQIPVLPGLSDSEFSAIESSCSFAFPPDLRSILREGLPVGTGFPNWRSSSAQPFKILLGLPVSGLLNEVLKGSFWSEAWGGSRPVSPAQALNLAKEVLDAAPLLVPIYRHFYIPSRPSLAGNPVFFVRGSELRCAGFDLADFFQREELRTDHGHVASPDSLARAPAPAWAAKSARTIEVWTDLVEGGGGGAVLRGSGWSGGGGGGAQELERSLKEVSWRLREGGWSEEDIGEMLISTNGGDDKGMVDRMVLRDRQSVWWHVRLLALALLRAGWPTEDVVDAMGGYDQRGGSTWQEDPRTSEISIEF